MINWGEIRAARGVIKAELVAAVRQADGAEKPVRVVDIVQQFSGRGVSRGTLYWWIKEAGGGLLKYGSRTKGGAA